ncbi:MAG: DUF5060 domain-containing protein, partial [Armatimonadota bacterium]|nr:DUF5060 domain-containing protein [Armatimonadota bacterium]
LFPAEAPTQWHPVTINMHLNREYSNPFDPAVVDVEGHFTGPKGDVTIPGFAYQDYVLEPGKKEPTAQGGLSWKVRFMPVVPGHYTYKVTLKDTAAETTLTAGAFDCTAAKDRGFVRISAKDPRAFEFEDQSYYYPIGLNVRHAGDRDNVHEGLPAITHYFDKMASVGLTWTRTWMSSWWLAIEWSHDYDARYHGVGRYNLSNAWLLDKTLEAADRDGLYVDLTLNNHGQFSRGSDPEWQYNPYNVQNGGRLTYPAEFFTDPWAKAMFKQRLRYIVARWGYSPHIFAWELFNEVDLTEGYSNQNVNTWMSEMSDYIHSIDPYQHLVSTHVCWWQSDTLLWSNPKLQFVQADGYVRWMRGRDTMATFTDKIWWAKEPFNKPAYIVEFGYKQDSQDTDASPQFHPGIWSGFMSPFSANSMYWDWYLVEQRNFWPQYAALVKFARGEDRRGQNLQVSDCTVDGPEYLAANGINNGTRAYAWVYHPARLNAWKDGDKTYNWTINGSGQGSPTLTTFAPVTGAKLKLGGLTDGSYHVEFWDTWKGVIIGETTVKATAAQIIVPLPNFKIDLALKIKRTDAAVATTQVKAVQETKLVLENGRV